MLIHITSVRQLLREFIVLKFRLNVLIVLLTGPLYFGVVCYEKLTMY